MAASGDGGGPAGSAAGASLEGTGAAVGAGGEAVSVVGVGEGVAPGAGVSSKSGKAGKALSPLISASLNCM